MFQQTGELYSENNKNLKFGAWPQAWHHTSDFLGSWLLICQTWWDDPLFNESHWNL